MLSPARIVGGVVVAIVAASERYRSSFSVVLGGRVGKIADIFPRCPIWTGRNGLEGLYSVWIRTQSLLPEAPVGNDLGDRHPQTLVFVLN